MYFFRVAGMVNLLALKYSNLFFLASCRINSNIFGYVRLWFIITVKESIN